jgi:hypothetical protein
MPSCTRCAASFSRIDVSFSIRLSLVLGRLTVLTGVDGFEHVDNGSHMLARLGAQTLW